MDFENCFLLYRKSTAGSILIFLGEMNKLLQHAWMFVYFVIYDQILSRSSETGPSSFNAISCTADHMQ